MDKKYIEFLLTSDLFRRKKDFITESPYEDEYDLVMDHCFKFKMNYERFQKTLKWVQDIQQSCFSKGVWCNDHYCPFFFLPCFACSKGTSYVYHYYYNLHYSEKIVYSYAITQMWLSDTYFTFQLPFATSTSSTAFCQYYLTWLPEEVLENVKSFF
jgi:hypothetical protein